MHTENIDFGLQYPFTEDDLKNARRALLAKYHPDRAAEDLKGEYTSLSQDINAEYSRMRLLCVSMAKKEIILLNRKHSPIEILYGIFLMFEIPAYLAIGVLLNNLDTQSHWLYLLSGTLVLLSVFLFYIARMKLAIRLQLLQLIAVFLLFAIPYPVLLSATATLIFLSLWVKPKLPFLFKLAF